MFVPPESSSAVLVMIRSKSVSICNRSLAGLVDCSIIRVLKGVPKFDPCPTMLLEVTRASLPNGISLRPVVSAECTSVTTAIVVAEAGDDDDECAADDAGGHSCIFSIAAISSDHHRPASDTSGLSACKTWSLNANRCQCGLGLGLINAYGGAGISATQLRITARRMYRCGHWIARS